MATNTTDQGNECRAKILHYMDRYKAEGALWTSDIAMGLRLRTAAVRRLLHRLEHEGMVRRVSVGNPTSWMLAEQ